MLSGVLECVCVCTCSCSISLACTHQFVLLSLSGCVTSGWVVGVGFSLFFAPLALSWPWAWHSMARRLHGQNAEVARPRPPLPSVRVSLPPSLKLSLFSVSFLWFEFCVIVESYQTLSFLCVLFNPLVIIRAQSDQLYSLLSSSVSRSFSLFVGSLPDLPESSTKFCWEPALLAHLPHRNVLLCT